MHYFRLTGAGLLAVLVYCTAVVLGGLLWPAYSHIAQPISDLVATGSPTKQLLDPLFFGYNVLTAGFAWGLLGIARSSPQTTGSRYGVAGGWALIVEALAGVLTLVFPEGQGGAHSPIGPAGFAHILFAGVSSICTLVAIPLLGYWLSARLSLAPFWRFSIAVVTAVALTGIATAVAVANQLSWAGLAERFTIGSFLLWVAVAAALTQFCCKD